MIIKRVQVHAETLKSCTVTDTEGQTQSSSAVFQFAFASERSNLQHTTQLKIWASYRARAKGTTSRIAVNLLQSQQWELRQLSDLPARIGILGIAANARYANAVSCVFWCMQVQQQLAKLHCCFQPYCAHARRLLLQPCAGTSSKHHLQSKPHAAITPQGSEFAAVPGNRG